MVSRAIHFGWVLMFMVAAFAMDALDLLGRLRQKWVEVRPKGVRVTEPADEGKPKITPSAQSDSV